MSIFSSYKKIFLLGFIIVILLAIPLSVYIAQKRQQTTTEAAKATILSLEPASLTAETDETISLDIVLDPGGVSSVTSNQVSFAKLIINFDPEKFTTVSDSLAPNPNSPNTLTSILEDPVYISGQASISLSIGADPTKALTTKATIATLKLKTLVPTDGNNPTSVVFDNSTQVLSIASSDQTNENVLSTTTPANITISGPAIIPSPTSTPQSSSQQSSSTDESFSSSEQNTSESIIVTDDPNSSESASIEATPTIEPVITQIPTTIPTPIILPPTGPGDKILGIGIAGAILALIGGVLFILL